MEKQYITDGGIEQLLDLLNLSSEKEMVEPKKDEECLEVSE